MEPSKEIDELISQHPNWRGTMLAKIRQNILESDPEIIEEWKWRGAPVWSLKGNLCVGNIYKDKVKIVFENGAKLNDPNKLFNAGLDGNKWQTIDFSEGDKIKKAAFKQLILEAVSFNKSKEKK